MNWDVKYQERSRIWGDLPSELAVIAVERLQTKPRSVVDLGCGYGRDARFLSGRLHCHVLGIDSSKEAIRMARADNTDDSLVEYCCCDFGEVDTGQHDVVLASNLYHLLGALERRRLGTAIEGLLKPGGLAFLNAVSEKDPHHFSEGAEKEGSTRREVEPSSEDELRGLFHSLEVKDLYEHEYFEPHSDGSPHHHISWILVAEKQ